MKYLFERDGRKVTVACEMSEIKLLTQDMHAKGFHRVYTVPGMTRQLDMNDAYDEMVEMDRVEDARRKKAGDEAWAEVGEIARG